MKMDLFLNHFVYVSRRIIMENKELETNVEIENKESEIKEEVVAEVAAEEVAAEEATIEEVAAEEAAEEPAIEEVAAEEPAIEEAAAEEPAAEEAIPEEETLTVAPEVEISEEEIANASFLARFKEKVKKVNWKKVWDKVTTGILIFLMATPILILVYIFYSFLSKNL